MKRFLLGGLLVLVVVALGISLERTGHQNLAHAAATATATPGLHSYGGFTGANSPYRNQCGGAVLVTAGSITVTAPCAVNFGWCSCSVASPLPPVAGDVCGCSISSTATIIGGATVTTGAFNIQVAGTPSPSPIVSYEAYPW